MKKLEIQLLVAFAVVGVAAYVIHRGAKSIAQGLNPTSDQNWAYQAVNKLGEAATGRRGWSFGSSLYDDFHQGDPWDPRSANYDPNAPKPDNWNMGGRDFGVTDTGSWDDQKQAYPATAGAIPTDYPIYRAPPESSLYDSPGAWG